MSAWDPSSLPDWLNAQVLKEKILPLLANVTTSAIATALGVSWVYASHIRAGAKRPHPRHWVKLAELVGGFGIETSMGAGPDPPQPGSQLQTFSVERVAKTDNKRLVALARGVGRSPIVLHAEGG